MLEITLGVKVQVLRMYYQKMSCVQIGKRLGINRQTAANIINDWFENHFGLTEKDIVWMYVHYDTNTEKPALELKDPEE